MQKLFFKSLYHHHLLIQNMTSSSPEQKICAQHLNFDMKVFLNCFSSVFKLLDSSWKTFLSMQKTFYPSDAKYFNFLMKKVISRRTKKRKEKLFHALLSEINFRDKYGFRMQKIYVISSLHIMICITGIEHKISCWWL